MSSVELTIAGPRADIRLNRPDVLNAMDFEVFDGLAAAAASISAEADKVRVVVVLGEGRAFCSGIDVTALGPIGEGLEPTIRRAQAGFRAIAALPMPTLAAVHRYAFGAGLQLALACDLRILAHGTQVGLLEANYGLIPDLIGSTRLPQLVGPARAKRMIWLAEKIGADEAERIGLAEWVVPDDELESAAAELAGRLAEAPFTPVREAKRLIDASSALSVEQGMDAEMAAQIACMTAGDFGENLSKGLQRLGKGH
ncbi:MAG: enoyl-CoA hydratase/isomerase family protein [Actinomycetota bacterium]